jgi:hypothetical protein
MIFSTNLARQVQFAGVKLDTTTKMKLHHPFIPSREIMPAKITNLGAQNFVTVMSDLVELQVDVKQQELTIIFWSTSISEIQLILLNKSSCHDTR